MLSSAKEILFVQSLVTEGIEEAIEEGLRKPEGFNINDLKKEKTLLGVKEYIKNTNLHYQNPEDKVKFKLGQGSARTAYMLSPKKVLKVANNLQSGLAQNKEEIKVFPKYPLLMPKIFDFDPSGMWIVTELVREFRNENDMRTELGFALFELQEWIKAIAWATRKLSENEIMLKAEKYLRENKTYLGISQNAITTLFQSDWAKEFLRFFKVEKPHTGDIFVISHYGKTADGRVVILDAGASQEVYNQYYR